MAIDYNGQNVILTEKLKALTEKDKDYWSFKGNANRGYGHGFFQYPAMMVPQVTKAIIDNIMEVHPNIQTIRDPFAGSGTVMTECMLRGLSFSGVDINPLAILLCRVKSGPFHVELLDQRSEVLKKQIMQDKGRKVEVNFQNRNKWFTNSAQIWLSKIRRSIMLEEALWARRFFWVALAETIRLTSNSRTSTFKLHIRTPENIEGRRNINIVEIFNKILDNNLIEYKNLADKLNENKLIENGTYNKNITISFADVRTINENKKANVIITSPPYGDNDTTVPYGQHSYLPLQWIDFFDIDKSIDKADVLASTHEIDYRSLGGHRGVTEEEKNQLLQQSDTLKSFTESLRDEPKDRTTRVVSFFRDLNKCIDPILTGLENGGIMVWVLGNRKVGGKRVPLDKVLSDLFEKRNVSVFCELSRKIPSKRMPLKNNIAETMSDEIILLMRKAG
jgi:site-specific DNA-adenine methylase